VFSYDTETTGSDLWHGCLPFFFSFTHDTGINEWYEWDVDPFTRLPVINKQELDQLCDTLCSDQCVMHNANFDIMATDKILEFANLGYRLDWDWQGIDDSCIASHVLENLWSHSLKELRAIFLLIDNTKQEALRVATNHARRIVRTNAFQEKHGIWRIADANDPHWPAISKAPKEKSKDVSGWWHMDTWLPRMIALKAPEFLPEEKEDVDRSNRNNNGDTSTGNRSPRNTSRRNTTNRTKTTTSPNNPGITENPRGHSWFTCLRNYAIEDSETTLVLWETLEREIKDIGLWDQYLERRRLIKITHNMQKTGVTVTPKIHTERTRYLETAQRNVEAATEIARKTKSKKQTQDVNIRSDKQLQSLLFTDLKLPIHVRTDTGQPSVKAEVLKKLYLETDNTEVSALLKTILLSRNNEKAASYLTGYRRWLIDETIHSGMNITGTKFTRQSSSQPNLTNIGTGKELEDQSVDYNLRECFGPQQFWKWLSYDYSNIELRIWGYDCGNKEFIYCFENDIPVHYLIACELHPELASLTPDEAKEDKRYKRTKNGNFAIIYGASPYKANATYGVPGAFEILSKRFPEVRTFTNKLFDQVARRGWIETMTGYRLHIPSDDPHVAVSGRVQGTAGAIIGRAMNDCTEELAEHPEFMTKLILQIHDELVFKCPLKTNYGQQITSSIFRNMEKQGEKIGIPLPVGGKEHTVDWSKGITIER